MSEQEPSTFRPFAFTVIEDDSVNVIIEMSEEDYKAETLENGEIKLLDVVALTENLESEGLRRGEVGTVVEQWGDGVFEIELSDDTGEAYAFVAVPARKLMKLYFRKDEAA
jgi:hypothetical protein